MRRVPNKQRTVSSIPSQPVPAEWWKVPETITYVNSTNKHYCILHPRYSKHLPANGLRVAGCPDDVAGRRVTNPIERLRFDGLVHDPNINRLVIADADVEKAWLSQLSSPRPLSLDGSLPVASVRRSCWLSINRWPIPSRTGESVGN